MKMSVIYSSLGMKTLIQGQFYESNLFLTSSNLNHVLSWRNEIKIESRGIADYF